MYPINFEVVVSSLLLLFFIVPSFVFFLALHCHERTLSKSIRPRKRGKKEEIRRRNAQWCKLQSHQERVLLSIFLVFTLTCSSHQGGKQRKMHHFFHSTPPTWARFDSISCKKKRINCPPGWTLRMKFFSYQHIKHSISLSLSGFIFPLRVKCSDCEMHFVYRTEFHFHFHYSSTCDPVFDKTILSISLFPSIISKVSIPYKIS